MYYRLYTGKDNKSHMEEFSPPNNMPATSVVFRNQPLGTFIDWHTAPRKQFLVTLEGEVEIGTGDGILHILGPGDMMLAEDITGQGHTTRVVGNKDRISIAIPVE